jgi:hypothetical protein
VETDHLGGDILAERRLTGDELAVALSSLLSLPPERIVTFEDWQELVKQPERTKVYCRYLPGGEFHTVVSLPDHVLKNLPRDVAGSRFAMLLGCRVLVHDGSVNPNSCLLYDTNGTIEHVHIMELGEGAGTEVVVCRG